MEELIELLREDADHFDCHAEINRIREIVRRGTSAHLQLKAYREALESGATHEEALRAVVDFLVETTLEGV